MCTLVIQFLLLHAKASDSTSKTASLIPCFLLTVAACALTCQNGRSLNEVNCTCDCANGYSGDDCTCEPTVYILEYHHTPPPHATTTTHCKLHECKWSICTSGWKEKHHQCKLQQVMTTMCMCKQSICASEWKKYTNSSRCNGQDQHQRKLEQDAATTCNSKHHQQQQPDQDQIQLAQGHHLNADHAFVLPAFGCCILLLYILMPKMVLTLCDLHWWCFPFHQLVQILYLHPSIMMSHYVRWFL